MKTKEQLEKELELLLIKEDQNREKEFKARELYEIKEKINALKYKRWHNLKESLSVKFVNINNRFKTGVNNLKQKMEIN